MVVLGLWRETKGRSMAEELDRKETVGFEELLMSNVIEQEALINLLEKKGIIRKGEVLEENKNLRDKKK